MNDGRTVIDPSSRNSKFKKLEDIKDFISVENVEIKNLNSITDWSLLKKFSNVRTLSLSNCLVDKKSFFESLSELKKISELVVDHYCFFQDSDKKRGKYHYDSRAYPYIATSVVKGKWYTSDYPELVSILKDYDIDPKIRGEI